MHDVLCVCSVWCALCVVCGLSLYDPTEACVCVCGGVLLGSKSKVSLWVGYGKATFKWKATCVPALGPKARPYSPEQTMLFD